MRFSWNLKLSNIVGHSWGWGKLEKDLNLRFFIWNQQTLGTKKLTFNGLKHKAMTAVVKWWLLFPFVKHSGYIRLLLTFLFKMLRLCIPVILYYFLLTVRLPTWKLKMMKHYQWMDIYLRSFKTDFLVLRLFLFKTNKGERHFLFNILFS